MVWLFLVVVFWFLNLLGILQNGMLFVATRQYAKTAGKPAKKAASKEIAQNASTGLTIKLTDEELTLPIEQLSFEQLYRRILHIWEEGKADPKKVWMFDLLKKAQTDEEWGQMLIICRIYQHRYSPTPFCALHILKHTHTPTIAFLGCSFSMPIRPATLLCWGVTLAMRTGFLKCYSTRRRPGCFATNLGTFT